MSGLDLIGDFANLWLAIACPDCKISNRIRLKEIIIESSIICRGCYKDFHLIQEDAGGTRSNRRIKAVEDKINDLSKTIVIDIKF